MSEDPTTIGIMHPAFRVGKRVLLEWVNDFFSLSYTKVEECASGAMYCQVCEAIWPNKVPLHKVKWDARSDYQFADNFKIVQSTFQKMGVQKPIPIEKLIKAKYQDNLEFLQWIKHFFECKYGGQPYDAALRRKEAKKGKKMSPADPNAPAVVRTSKPKPAAASVTKPSATRKGAVAAKKPSTAAKKASEAKASEMEETVASLEVTVEGLKKERNFYYGKLREIEVMCQDVEFGDDMAKAEDFKSKVLAILYKTDEDDEGGAEETEEAADEEPAAEEAAEEPAAHDAEETW